MISVRKLIISRSHYFVDGPDTASPVPDEVMTQTQQTVNELIAVLYPMRRNPLISVVPEYKRAYDIVEKLEQVLWNFDGYGERWSRQETWERFTESLTGFISGTEFLDREQEFFEKIRAKA